MSHTPFIVASYAIGFVVLTWCAIYPLLRKKKIARDIRQLNRIEERKRDSDS